MHACMPTHAGPEGGTLALGYRWERATFPWLMTWEENRARQQAPWNGRTLVRGLEFGSYAFATSRRDNVERGKLMGQPCFEWLDAHEVSACCLDAHVLCWCVRCEPCLVPTSAVRSCASAGGCAGVFRPTRHCTCCVRVCARSCARAAQRKDTTFLITLQHLPPQSGADAQATPLPELLQRVGYTESAGNGGEAS
jgi:hypothetical protein